MTGTVRGVVPHVRSRPRRPADLQARTRVRPGPPHVVFAALGVGRLIEDPTGSSIHRFVRTARRYRTVHIRAGNHLLTAGATCVQSGSTAILTPAGVCCGRTQNPNCSTSAV